MTHMTHISQGCLLFLFWYPIMTALATGHSSLTQYVRRCAILTGVTAVSDCTTLGFMIIFIDKAPIPLLATVYVCILLINKQTNISLASEFVGEYILLYIFVSRRCWNDVSVEGNVLSKSSQRRKTKINRDSIRTK